MKLIRQIPLMIVLSLLLSFYTLVNAQECDTYFPLKEGAVYEMEGYDGADKKTSRTVYNIKEVKTSGIKKEGKVHVEMYDKKDKKEQESDFTLACEGGKVSVDMKMFIPPSSMEGFKNMDMKMEGQNVIYPGSLTSGQTLQDATMRMAISDKASGNEMGTVNINIINRKVVGKEKITTPAGTFEAYKVTYDITIETVMMGMRLPGNNLKGVEYISPGTGIIRNESYNQKDKLMGYQILTKFSK